MRTAATVPRQVPHSPRAESGRLAWPGSAPAWSFPRRRQLRRFPSGRHSSPLGLVSAQLSRVLVSPPRAGLGVTGCTAAQQGRAAVPGNPARRRSGKWPVPRGPPRPPAAPRCAAQAGSHPRATGARGSGRRGPEGGSIDPARLLLISCRLVI